MTLKNLEQTLLAANRRRYQAAKKPLRSHGPDHHWRVYEYARNLAKKLGTAYDPQVLAGAALLHDLAAYYPEETKESYHDFDHQLAAEVLTEIDFPADKRARVLDAIAHHGSDAKYKRADESTETTLLRDADKLDVFGPMGVARIIMARTLKGDSLEDIVADFYTPGHLQRKWNSITSDAARAMAQKDYEYSKAFFEQLAQKFA
jgi:HD superfamily phosphodiesterase